MEPTGCGIGGDLFAIVWDAASKKLHGLNASGRSPLSLSRDQLRAAGLKSVPERGPLAVSVPGAVDGWFELHARFGRLRFSELLAPSIAYAREGFPVSEVIARRRGPRAAQSLRRPPGFAAVYLPDGRAPAARRARSQTQRSAPALRAHRERAGATRSTAAPIARRSSDRVRAHGGFVSREDLAAHRSEWVEPVATTIAAARLGAAAERAGDRRAPDAQHARRLRSRALGFGSVEHLHLLIEAKKLAFEDRARFYADPEFARVPVAELISKAYAAARRKQDRSAARAATRAGTATRRAGAGDTIYLTTADEDGNMVSLIQSNYTGSAPA